MMHRSSRSFSMDPNFFFTAARPFLLHMVRRYANLACATVPDWHAVFFPVNPLCFPAFSGYQVRKYSYSL